jgi:hypothetical protein
MKKLFCGVRGWFADAADHIQLFWVDQKIDSLNDDLESAVGDERFYLFILLDLHSGAHNKILNRINNRACATLHSQVTH